MAKLSPRARAAAFEVVERVLVDELQREKPPVDSTFTELGLSEADVEALHTSCEERLGIELPVFERADSVPELVAWILAGLQRLQPAGAR